MSLETENVQKDSKFSILHPIASLTHKNTSTSSNNHNHNPDQLLRLRIINGEFTHAAATVDTYAVVSIGRQSARTKVVKNSNKPVYEENFAIGYELEDEQSEIVIDVFEKGLLSDSRIGEYRLKLLQVDPPKNRRAKRDNNLHKEDVNKVDDTPLPGPLPVANQTAAPSKNKQTWATAVPREAALLDRTGTRAGTLWILLRREMRLHGRLNINVGDLNINAASPSGYSFDVTHPFNIITKLGQERNESAPVQPQGTKVPFAYRVQFEVNDVNNISDVFFEMWQDGKAIAEARLPLYDTKKRYNGPLIFVTPFGGHDVTNTNVKHDVGTLHIDSVFESADANELHNNANSGHA